MLLGDEGRLRQVLFNLIGNAVKFTEHGLGRRRGRVTATLDDDRVELRSPCATPASASAPTRCRTLFERFTQADSGIARRYGGSGLGLAISRGLVDLMGGSIDVETELGRGSTFRVVAAAAPRPVAAAGRRRHAASTRTADMAGGLRILVAEDNEVNQLVVSAMLAQLGHSCEIASDGLEVVAQVDVEPLRPRADGHPDARTSTAWPRRAAIRALDSRARASPIIALTANAMAEDREAFLEAGMDDHVAKPIDAEGARPRDQPRDVAAAPVAVLTRPAGRARLRCAAAR